jgi:NAD(P)-dependent dehydrogenase (short-subunit alcohol dehydrogenase family)
MSSGGALVTGSARGIGRAIVLALAADGYDVAVHFRSSEAEAEATRGEAAALGAQAITVQGDLRKLDRAAEIVHEASRELGSLRVLVNNVGNYLFKPLLDTEPAEWDDILESNLSATYATCRAAVPLMRTGGGGRIVNIGYAGAQNLVARPSLTPYAIAKTGVVLLTKAIAKAEAANGITANVVAPGVIETSATQPLREIPMGRVGRVEEVASTVCWLVSPAADYVTGQVVDVAGGWNV